MDVKEIRAMTGLSKDAFAKKYNIPVDTIKGWEAECDSKRYRKCPEYVKSLLESAVKREKRIIDGEILCKMADEELNELLSKVIAECNKRNEKKKL